MKKSNYSPYTIIKKNYANGGNANIHLVEDKSKKLFVLKSIVIHEKKDVKKVKRFINEIKIVEKFQNNICGIIPVMFKSIPVEIEKLNSKNYDQLKGVEVWYVMELAIPLKKKINEANTIKTILSCMISLSETLEKLHKENIVHRDIKPSNLYFYKDKWAFGDFGLVEYPDFTGNTEVGERIGNYATIAPEMRRIKKAKNAKPADVWSMAKTLWMLLNNDYDSCFEGPYNSRDDKISLNDKFSKVPLGALENLFEKSLKYDPNERIDIVEFKKMLIKFKAILEDSEGVISVEKLSKIQNESKQRIFFNSADMSGSTDKILYDFYMNWIPEDQHFIDNGLEKEVQILNYISMKLEHYCENKFFVSPIVGHFRNAQIPSIKIFVKYTNEELKFVTFVLVYNDTIFDFTRRHNFSLRYDGQNDIQWDHIDRFVEFLDNTAFKLADEDSLNKALNSDRPGGLL